MKKIIATAALTACAAVVTAQTVTSANIVGYSKVDAVGGELSLVAINFDPSGATIEDLCDGLPSGSAVYVWDKDVDPQTYHTAIKGSRGWTGGDFVLELGDTMWLAADGTATNELIFSGEVLAEDAVVAIPDGTISATGYFFPVAVNVESTEIGDAVDAGSAIYVWDADIQDYVSAIKGSRGWTGSAPVGVSQGFWVENVGAATNVTVAVPY